LFGCALKVRAWGAVAFVAVDHAFRAAAVRPRSVARGWEFAPVFAANVVVVLVAAVGAVVDVFVRRWLSAGRFPITSPLRGGRHMSQRPYWLSGCVVSVLTHGSSVASAGVASRQER